MSLKNIKKIWNMMNDNGTYQHDDDFPIGPGSYNITGQLRLSNTYSDRKVPVSVSIEVIPEPATILLFGLGGLMFRKRRA